MARAAADLDKIMAGSWKEDIEVARAAVLMAESEVESSKIMLDRLTVRALSTARCSRSTSGPVSSPPWPGTSR